jgi:hypothetical protein
MMPIYTRHNEVIVLDRKSGTVDAHYFNIVQSALKTNHEPFRFRIPGLNHLDLIVQDDAWVVVDRVLNDVPVAAWTNFQTEGRDSLHEPIACEIRLFHFAARTILKTTLEAMEEKLGQTRSEQNEENTGKVLPFKKNQEQP